MPAPTSYNPVAKGLHWLMALLIIGLWSVGMVMEDMPKGDFRSQVIGLHKAIGVIVLLLTMIRLTWRLTNPAPELPATMPALERLGAKLGHLALYTLMIVMPIDGILMTQAKGRVVDVFGFVLPTLVEKNDELKHLFSEGHEAMGLALAVVLVVHVAAAIRHHVLLKDDVLKRMLPGRA
ncbi:MAG: cytochrome b [Rhodospirillaceae bacterium]|nr:cytochrome b [Rhodospirillales bacterium]